MFSPCAYNGETMKGGPAILPCIDCLGTGEVADKFPEWEKRGRELFEARVARLETLRNFFLRTGVDPTLRSRQERGLEDPTGATP